MSDVRAAQGGRSARLVGATAAPPCIAETPQRFGELGPLPGKPGRDMRYQSPLRYPGAKSGLVPLIAETVTAASQSLGRLRLLVEPFAGGASTSLRVASAGIVERVLLADADPLVARFWQVAASETDWLIGRMWDEPVTLDRWDYWRAWIPKRDNDRETAVKCLFLNRTTFSGILHGRAGPIGGRAQSSEYKIDCRFNKSALEQRLRLIGDLYTAGRIADVWCKDWQATLADVAEWYPQLLPNKVVAYLDPPYLEKSAKLYGRSFDPHGGYGKNAAASSMSAWGRGREHYRLAEYLRRKVQYRWILSYDNHPSLLCDPALYASRRMTPSRDDKASFGVKEWSINRRLVNLNYSVSGSGKYHKAEELLITTLPASRIPQGPRMRPV
ncbi:DNA adenine methylase [Paractinoplanes toevensis]|uniref:DNA adenine methylase n=1 Tax=Paractinoplanes toevensis TaxID=571911 RepID=A0A919W7P1_9ACTN|nr:DNA adenine methylase [Actinoplanes toevensis]GIM95688.1 hypothetical protein Ato02nite_074810 [Actinoplanes toevensis]